MRIILLSIISTFLFISCSKKAEEEKKLFVNENSLFFNGDKIYTFKSKVDEVKAFDLKDPGTLIFFTKKAGSNSSSEMKLKVLIEKTKLSSPRTISSKFVNNEKKYFFSAVANLIHNENKTFFSRDSTIFIEGNLNSSFKKVNFSKKLKSLPICSGYSKKLKSYFFLTQIIEEESILKGGNLWLKKSAKGDWFQAGPDSQDSKEDNNSLFSEIALDSNGAIILRKKDKKGFYEYVPGKLKKSSQTPLNLCKFDLNDFKVSFESSPLFLHKELKNKIKF